MFYRLLLWNAQITLFKQGKFVENLNKISLTFGITTKRAHELILSYSNRSCLRILETSTCLFEYAFDEIISTSKRLLSDEYIMGLMKPEKTIPFDKAPRIYFLYDSDVLVYIGKTTNISDRISTHLKTKTFDGVYTTTVDRDLLGIVESLNIFYYKPKYNKDMFTDERFFEVVLSKCIFE